MRVRAMAASIFVYSAFTAAGYFATGAWQLAALREAAEGIRANHSESEVKAFEPRIKELGAVIASVGEAKKGMAILLDWTGSLANPHHNYQRLLYEGRNVVTVEVHPAPPAALSA